MPVRRTHKKEEQAELLALEAVTYSLPDTQSSLSLPSKKSVPDEGKHQPPTLREIFGYDPALLLSDVKKTLLTTTIILLALGAVTWYLNASF
jgi:hypothetical protein